MEVGWIGVFGRKQIDGVIVHITEQGFPFTLSGQRFEIVFAFILHSDFTDMANRQGLDENIYYQLFVEIILVGIKEFERYRQNIVRKINVKNQVEGQKATPISDRVLNRPTSVSGLTKEEVVLEYK